MSDPKYDVLLSKLNDLVKEFGKTKVARILGVSRPTIYKLLKHPERMTIHHLFQIELYYESYKMLKQNMKE